ncbi:MAG: universal stress protein [Nitrospirae bacterium]|nr:universal stress protein [Nitrospirota bacterium]
MDYKVILCPIDSSGLKDKSVEVASYISGLSGAKLILLNVVEKWYRSEPMVTDSPQWTSIHEDWLNEGRSLLESEARKLVDQGHKNVETILSEGDAAHEIVAEAIKNRADMIVMATHRYSSAGKFFLGSVTDRVTKKSPCPVMWVFG